MTPDEALFAHLHSFSTSFIKRTLELHGADLQRDVMVILAAGGTVDARIAFRLDGTPRFSCEVIGPDGVRRELWGAPT